MVVLDDNKKKICNLLEKNNIDIIPGLKCCVLNFATKSNDPALNHIFVQLVA